jgi:hypothetical protein
MTALEGKTALVNLRMPPSLKAAAQRAAAEDRRSLTSLIEKLLVEYLRNHPVSAAAIATPRQIEMATAAGRPAAQRAYGRIY